MNRNTDKTFTAKNIALSNIIANCVYTCEIENRLINTVCVCTT